MPLVQTMPNGDRTTDLSADWFEVLPAVGSASFFVDRRTGQSQYEFPAEVLAILGSSSAAAAAAPEAAAAPQAAAGAAEGAEALQRRIAEREATLALLREMGCREDDTAELEADLAALKLEAAGQIPAPGVPAPAPAAGGLGLPPAQQPVVRAFCHVSGDGTKTSYSDADNRLISEAQARGLPAVRLSGGFEVRLGANAVSSKWDTPPSSGMIQVNLANDNARLVKALSSGSPSAPATPPPGQPSRASATSEETIKRRIAEQEATLALLRESGVADEQLMNLEADIATLRASILPPTPRNAAGAGGGGGALQRGMSTATAGLIRNSSAVVRTKLYEIDHHMRATHTDHFVDSTYTGNGFFVSSI